MQDLESTNWPSSCADEMIRQLLDNNYLRPEYVTESSSGDPNDSPINQLMYEIYSGPTIEDIESAVSRTDCNMKIQPEDVSQNRDLMSSRSHDHNYRYTLRIKSCDNIMADDGYKWRKYGQKFIKNSPNPR